MLPDYIRFLSEGFPRRLRYKSVAGPKIPAYCLEEAVFDQKDIELRNPTHPKPYANFNKYSLQATQDWVDSFKEDSFAHSDWKPSGNGEDVPDIPEFLRCRC